ncbi:MAG: hypothetical protein JWP69_1479 [Flaviaesturariibacter sp.]|nr:hypothetical protein [Flaviaesturariibacter sp.]
MFLFFLLYRRWQRRAARRIGDPGLVDALMKGYSPSRMALKFSFLFLAFALGIITLANPRREGQGEPDIRNGIDLVLAVDVSKSMLATDVSPNRLTAAKALLRQLLKDRPNDRIALVLFASHAYSQLPLTYDHGNAELLIDAIDPNLFTAQGTAVADALIASKDFLAGSERRYKAVVLLSDGETFDQESKDGNAIAWAEELRDAGIMVTTVGFGSPGGASIIDPVTKAAKKDLQGNTVISKLDEALLQEIAAITKGQYFRFSQVAETGRAVVKSLSAIKEVTLVDKSLLSYQSLYIWFAIPMLMLLSVELFIPDRKKVKA